MEQETAYLAALAMANSYKFEDGQRLILLDSEGRRVVDYSEARTFDLTETVWFLESLNNGDDAVVSVLEGSEITARSMKRGWFPVQQAVIITQAHTSFRVRRFQSTWDR